MLNYSIPIQLLIKMFKIEKITEMREKFWYVEMVYFIIKEKIQKKGLFIRENCPKNRMFLFRAFDPIRCWH